MLKAAIEKLILRENLSFADMQTTMQELISTDKSEQISAFISLLSAKGETVEELYAILCFMQNEMIKVKVDVQVLDIVGTGGDGHNTVNISTASALLAASCGVNVVKHGNRSVSSLCGSADILEALGVDINLNPEQVAHSVATHHFGYCYAPLFHKALLKLKKVRKNLNIFSTFNLIAPLLNPANAEFLMIGVARKDKIELIAELMLKMNIQRGLVFHCNGLDELCCVGPINIIEINKGQIHSYILESTALGLPRCTIEDLRGGSATINAKILSDALKGKPSAIANSLILNAGLANYLYGIATTMEEGIHLAQTKLKEGAAYTLLNDLRKSNKLDVILSNKLLEVKTLRQTRPYHKPKSLKKSLSAPGLSIIAEVKRRSPVKIMKNKDCDPTEIVDSYVSGRASAVSVLTDQKYFGGSLQDLHKVMLKLQNSTIPVIRKDFIIDKAQILESLIHGADAILLIVSVLKEKIPEYLQICSILGLEAIVEIHDAEELTIALAAGAEIIAINNRNLKTFSVDLNNSLQLIKYIPEDIIKISASGIKTINDLKKMQDAGFDAVLMGETFMQSNDPAQHMIAMRGGL